MLDGCISLNDRNGGDDLRHATQCFGIVDGEWVHRSEGTDGCTVGGDPSGLHADQIGPELREFGDHEAVNAFANRRQQHDGCDADGDTQHGQGGAQPVGAHRAQ